MAQHTESKRGAIGEEVWEKRLQEAVDKIPDGVIRVCVVTGSSSYPPLGDWISKEEQKAIHNQVIRCEHCLDFTSERFMIRLMKAKDGPPNLRHFRQVDKCKPIGVWQVYLRGGYLKFQRQNLEKHLEICHICGPIVEVLKNHWQS